MKSLNNSKQCYYDMVEQPSVVEDDIDNNEFNEQEDLDG